jgi:hypothetical protein
VFKRMVPLVLMALFFGVVLVVMLVRVMPLHR